jgi:hypothetical protein
MSVPEPLPLLMNTFQLLRSKLRHRDAVVPVHEQLGQRVDLNDISSKVKRGRAGTTTHMRRVVLHETCNPLLQLGCRLHVLLVCLDESVETRKQGFEV